MSYLEEILKESSERERDFTPSPEQWRALRTRLAEETRSARNRPDGRYAIGLLLLITLALSGFIFSLQFGKPLALTPHQVILGALPVDAPEERSKGSSGKTGDASGNYRDATPVSPEMIVPARTGNQEKEASPNPGNADTGLRKPTIFALDPLPALPPAALYSNLKARNSHPRKESANPEAQRQPVTKGRSPDRNNVPELSILPSGREAMQTILSASNLVPPAKIRPIGRKPAPTHWYIQADFHGDQYPLEANPRLYQTTPNGGPSTIFPLAGTGEWLELFDYDGGFVDILPGQAFAKYYGLSAGRRFRSGFDLSLGMIYYQDAAPEKKFLRRVPDIPGIAYNIQFTRGSTLYGRLDLRYLFLRRHRFRPYLGGTLVWTVLDVSVLKNTMYIPDRSIFQEIETRYYLGRSYFYQPVPVPRLGFEYDLSRRWQIGADLLAIFPGVQVQYNFR